MGDGAEPVPDPRHGWLAAVLPAHARRFRTPYASLAGLLEASGAELLERRPDVEIAPAGELRGDADYGIVPIWARESRSRSRLVRGFLRLLRSIRVLASLRSAKRSLARVGYAELHVLTWEREEPLLIRAGDSSRRPLAHRFPLNAVAFAGNAARSTVLEAALAEAARSCTGAVREERVFLGSGGVVVVRGEREVVRVVVGPTRSVEAQRDALSWLSGADVADSIRQLIPVIVASGETGLSRWTVETRLGGERSGAAIPSRLMAECVEFLAALFLAGRGTAAAGGPVSDAAVVADRCPTRTAIRVQALARQLEEKLSVVPRGFAHGDFWSGNLLVNGERSLTGVVDWAASGPGRLPLLDLLQLQVSMLCEEAQLGLGSAVVDTAARLTRGEDVHVGPYCRLIGLDLSPALSRSLLLAYWLAAAARGIVDPDRPDTLTADEWSRENLDPVLEELV